METIKCLTFRHQAKKKLKNKSNKIRKINSKIHKNQKNKKKFKPKNLKQTSRKTSKKTETKIWTLFLKKQSGTPPPSSELSGQRDLSLCHHGNIHHSVVELICGTSTNVWKNGSCRCIATTRLPHNRDTDSEEPPPCSALSGWLVLGVAT